MLSAQYFSIKKTFTASKLRILHRRPTQFYGFYAHASRSIHKKSWHRRASPPRRAASAHRKSRDADTAHTRRQHQFCQLSTIGESPLADTPETVIKRDGFQHSTPTERLRADVKDPFARKTFQAVATVEGILPHPDDLVDDAVVLNRVRNLQVTNRLVPSIIRPLLLWMGNTHILCAGVPLKIEHLSRGGYGAKIILRLHAIHPQNSKQITCYQSLNYFQTIHFVIILVLQKYNFFPNPTPTPVFMPPPPPLRPTPDPPSSSVEKVDMKRG